MLTRRYIREKVLEALYEHRIVKCDIQFTIKNVFKNLESTISLFRVLQEFLISLHKRAMKSLEIEKFQVSKLETKFPDRHRFIGLPVFEYLNQDFARETLNKGKLFWDDEPQFVEKVWIALKNSNIYNNFMSKDEINQKESMKFINGLYEKFIASDEDIIEFLEEKEIGWASNLALANTILYDRLNKMKNEKLVLYRSKEDKEFLKRLLEETERAREENRNIISKYFQNWESNRVAILDFLVMEMAVTEFTKFPTIPVKVTINEYIEIVSEYSTPKSKVFINGVLDNVLKELRRKGVIQKLGRGLIEN